MDYQVRKVQQEISNLLKQTNGTEFEIRFGTFGKFFDNNIPIGEFYRILDKFQQNNDFININGRPLETVDTRYSSNWRKTVDNSVSTYSKKTLVDKIDIPDYYSRVALSTETPSIFEQPDDIGQIQKVRNKCRWSFVTTKQANPLYYFQIDMTKVIDDPQGQQRQGRPTSRPQFEIEIEVREKIDRKQLQLKDVWVAIQFMIGLVQDSIMPITFRSAQSVILAYNNIFIDRLNHFINERLKTQKNFFYARKSYLLDITIKPINLKIDNLDNANELAVTEKADGLRRFLFFKRDGGYLVFPPNKVSKFILDIPSQLENTIIDGELVNGRMFHIFDILAFQGKDILNNPFSSRLKILDSIQSYFPQNVILKTFYKSGNFYSRTNKALNMKYKHEIDGLILNVLDSNRVVYKWKPPSQLTIDFYLQSTLNPNEFSILNLNTKGSNPRYINFKGTRKHPFSGIVKLASPFNKSGQIVEMSWDKEKQTFEPFRIRFDRIEPNGKEVALSIWMDIMNPITESTIRGLDLIPMRRFHNFIKKDMLEKYCKKCNLLDIGAGRGGDLHKWKNLDNKNIFAIEPNPDYLIEFRKRLIESGWSMSTVDIFTFNNTNLHLINAGGENVSTIMDSIKGYDIKCITMFNVLTFFYESEKMLTRLVDLITDILPIGGNFLGLVMDGKTVIDAFGDKDIIGDETSWTIKRMGGNKIRIDLGQDTIVNDQVEYITDFDKLITLMSNRGFTVNTQMLPENVNLSKSQSKLNSFYRSFVFTKSKNVEKSNTLLGDSVLTEPVITRIPVKTDSFVSLTSQTILRPEEARTVRVKEIDFTVIGVMNSECPIGAIMRANLGDKYVKLTEKSKKELNNKILMDLRKNLKIEFENPKEFVHVKRIYGDIDALMKALKECTNWIWFNLWDLISKIINKNLIIVIKDSPFVKPIIQKAFKAAGDDLLVLYYSEMQYNPLAQLDGNSQYVTKFKKGDLTFSNF